MSWIVIPYFLNLAPLDTLHPLFSGPASSSTSPSASWSLFYSSRLVVRTVDRSESCLIPVIRE
ncbi:hypothetical protein CUU62_16165 [Pseudomonas sp. WP001]|uniref:Uncharacterized protein n=1 Tax=Pseudomonas orientalis TaxID=76758 RepID=A0A4Q7CYK0_9PSED|nr:hypothetical protein CUU62_16165 [Pseudomonas sp. WP001]RZI19872.1 hypothetical protein EUX53_20295 [Pseudomonas orientalis]RZI30447.1 hypothetical protein EUX57_17675 [Pseudomonas orientalis]